VAYCYGFFIKKATGTIAEEPEEQTNQQQSTDGEKNTETLEIIDMEEEEEETEGNCTGSQQAAQQNPIPATPIFHGGELK